MTQTRRTQPQPDLPSTADLDRLHRLFSARLDTFERRETVGEQHLRALGLQNTWDDDALRIPLLRTAQSVALKPDGCAYQLLSELETALVTLLADLATPRTVTPWRTVTLQEFLSRARQVQDNGEKDVSATPTALRLGCALRLDWSVSGDVKAATRVMDPELAEWHESLMTSWHDAACDVALYRRAALYSGAQRGELQPYPRTGVFFKVTLPGSARAAQNTRERAPIERWEGLSSVTSPVLTMHCWDSTDVLPLLQEAGGAFSENRPSPVTLPGREAWTSVLNRAAQQARTEALRYARAARLLRACDQRDWPD